MHQGSMLTKSALVSCVLRWQLSSRLKKMTSKLRSVPPLHHLFANGTQRGSNCALNAPLLSLATRNRQCKVTGATSRPKQQHNQFSTSRPCMSGGDWGDGGDERHQFPVKLMDFPQTTMPDIVKSFRNRFFSFLIRGYYDNTFSLDGFLQGAMQAATFVSTHISEGNFAELKGLVSDEAIPEIQNNYADLNYQQRRWLKVKPSEIIHKFVYEIGMMFDDDTDQRFVEITVVLHGYHNLEENSHTNSISDIYNHMAENPDNFYVCNYRFIREFTKGVEDSWTINKLNHFLPRVPQQE